MHTMFVKAVFDLDCEWSNTPPSYRVYVNDEMFSERTWIWTTDYLEEILQIETVPGRYHVRIESLDSEAKFITSNHRILHGPGQWIDSNILEIFYESQ